MLPSHFRRARPRRSPPVRVRWRPWLDRLEDRAVPAIIVWDGGPTGQGTNWLDPANWAGDALPGPNDDAVIAAGDSLEITLAGNAAVHSATIGRTLRCTAGALTVGAAESTFADLIL